ncbi:MAG: hypothetical protein RLP14_00150, partial [Owenweeksia sp.]
TPVVTTGPDTSCNDDNGSVVIDVTGFPDGSGDYTYNIYAGTSTVGAADSSNTVGTFVNLPAGDYAIEVIDN